MLSKAEVQFLIDEMECDLTVLRKVCLYVDFDKAEGWNDPNSRNLGDVTYQQISNTKRLVVTIPELAGDQH
jgi:hypothetical protein